MATSTERNWANLPLDLLGEIANRLTLRDCRRFRGVCTSWASVEFPYMPYILLPGDDGEYRSLISAADHPPLPAPPLPVLRGKWCVGSQDSWLATLDKFEVNLLNLITGEEIKLPHVAKYRPFDTVAFYCILRACWIFDFPHREFRLLPPKIAFSPNPSPTSYTAVALVDYPAKFMYTRAGEGVWTTADELGHALDVIYRDGRFLAIFANGETVAVDLGMDGRHSEVITGRSAYSSPSIRYLVDSAGDLLQVQRHFRQTRLGDGDTIDIKVFRWDAERDVWAVVESLGDRSLFVGTCCCFFLSAQEIPGLKGNRVYFTDDFKAARWIHEGREATCDVGVFRLEDGSIEPYLPSIQKPLHHWRPPSWIILPKAMRNVGVDR